MWNIFAGHSRSRKPRVPSPQYSSVSKTSSSFDGLVVMMISLLLLTCIVSTMLLSKVLAMTRRSSSSSSSSSERDSTYSTRPRTTNLWDTVSIPQYDLTSKYRIDDPTQVSSSSLLRRKQSPPQKQRRRQLYDFVTPTILDCSSSGLLETCPYVDNNSTTINEANLFDGSCPSNLQQMITDNWCYDGTKEVCCGVSSQDCCGIAKSYLALFFLLAMMVISPIFIVCICAYGRCCRWYPYLWNAKSHCGCGSLPPPPPPPAAAQSSSNGSIAVEESPVGDIVSTDPTAMVK
jgi:hypothetical protein